MDCHGLATFPFCRHLPSLPNASPIPFCFFCFSVLLPFLFFYFCVVGSVVLILLAYNVCLVVGIVCLHSPLPFL